MNEVYQFLSQRRTTLVQLKVALPTQSGLIDSIVQLKVA